MRLILQLCLMALILLGVGNRAWGKVAVGQNIAVRGFAQIELFSNGGDEPPALESSGEAAAWGYDVASDVRDGPNVYAYVKQNPWTAWDPHGLSGWMDPRGLPGCSPQLRTALEDQDRQKAASLARDCHAVGQWMHEHPRTMGAVQTVGGGIQVAAGVIGLGTPEPTGLTKAAGYVAVAHGADDVQAGLRQMWSGKHVDNITTQATEGIVKAAGGSDAQAKAAGIVVNVGAGLVAPVASAQSAFRQSSEIVEQGFKGIILNGKIVGKPMPIESLAAHADIAKRAGLLQTAPSGGTPGVLKDGAEAFTAFVKGDKIDVIGSPSFSLSISEKSAEAVRKAMRKTTTKSSEGGR